MKNNLKKHRQAYGLTQAKAAKEIGVTERQYQNLEYATPKSVIQFYNISKLFNVTIDDLLRPSGDSGLAP